jgi:hypothetical protein
MKAAMPVNGQTSTALGVSLRKVVIKQMVPERGVAICEDSVNNTTEVPYRVQNAKGRIPQVGEVWYVDRSMGPWTFQAFVAADDTAFTTAEDQFTFSKGLVLPDGQQLLVGAVPASVTASFGTRRAATTDAVLGFGVAGDTASRIAVYSDGKIEWGPGGVTARDTTLQREAAGVVGVGNAVVAHGQTWQTPTYETGWSGSTTLNGVGGPTLKYRIDAEDNLWLYGLFKTTLTTSVNPVFMLPSAWRPAASGWIFGQKNNAGTLSIGTAFISSSGNVDLFAGQGLSIPATSGVEFFFNGKIPMGVVS